MSHNFSASRTVSGFSLSSFENLKMRIQHVMSLKKCVVLHDVENITCASSEKFLVPRARDWEDPGDTSQLLRKRRPLSKTLLQESDIRSRQLFWKDLITNKKQINNKQIFSTYFTLLCLPSNFASKLEIIWSRKGIATFLLKYSSGDSAGLFDLFFCLPTTRGILGSTPTSLAFATASLYIGEKVSSTVLRFSR